MDKDLYDFLNNSDNHAINTIQMTEGTPYRYVWVIVENKDDVKVYRPYFNEKVKLNTSKLDNDSHSCVNVEQIVEEFKSGSSTVIGIRDADSTKFIASYCLPDNVFRTDQRDVEMMMLYGLKDCEKFKSKYEDVDKKIEDALVVESYLGVYRIYNDEYKCGFNFSIHINDNELFDKVNKCKCENYQDTLNTMCSGIPEINYDSYKTHLQAISNNPYDYCQGHAVVGDLLLMKISRRNLTTKAFVDNMCDCYHNGGYFKNTKLYSDLCAWERMNGYDIIVKA